MKTRPNRGSHLPVLMDLFPKTTGPILELGSGMYSTCYLHWACFATKRPLVTYESSKEWIGFAQQFVASYHTVNFVEDLSTVDLGGQWSIAFVDHDQPGFLRGESVRKLVTAEYVVCHDCEGRNNRKYGYSSVAGLFKYRYEYADAGLPHTAIFSNVHDLTDYRVG